MVETSDSAFGYEAAGQRMKASEMALARLLQALAAQLGATLTLTGGRAGAVVTLGE